MEDKGKSADTVKTRLSWQQAILDRRERAKIASDVSIVPDGAEEKPSKNPRKTENDRRADIATRDRCATAARCESGAMLLDNEKAARIARLRRRLNIGTKELWELPSEGDKAIAVLSKHFPPLPIDRATEMANDILLAVALYQTAVPVDSRIANRLNEIERATKQYLPALDRLLAAEYPDEMEAVRQAIERELRKANASRALKKVIGPPHYVLINSLRSVYREAAGKEPSCVVDRVTLRAVPSKFTDFISDCFRTFCDGEEPSLDTIREVLYPHA
jgi:hypothetical protein